MWVWTNLSATAASVRPFPSHSEFPPVALVVHLFSCLQPLTTTDLIFVLILFLFPECHIDQYSVYPFEPGFFYLA